MHWHAAQMLAFSKQTCGKEWFNEMKYGHKIRYYFNATFADKMSEFELNKWPYTYSLGLVTATRIPPLAVQNQRVQVRSPNQVLVWWPIHITFHSLSQIDLSGNSCWTSGWAPSSLASGASPSTSRSASFTSSTPRRTGSKGEHNMLKIHQGIQTFSWYRFVIKGLCIQIC